jgi:hypothetical protein
MSATWTRPVTGIADILGVWRRSLIRWPDGKTDATTAVRWMQTPSLFVDLRQPANRPSFDGVNCLRDLGRSQIEWMARQEGFAGEVLWDGRHIEWQRQFDIQPKSAIPDVGKLWFDGDVMLEEGRDIAYLEHWHRAVIAPHPCAGIALREATTGQAGMLVRAGNLFMYARARLNGLPPLSDLRELIHAAPTIGDMQDLVDCEISFGSVGADGWRIEHSSLPFKEHRCLRPLSEHRGTVLCTQDLDGDGKAVERQWNVVRQEGGFVVMES